MTITHHDFHVLFNAATAEDDVNRFISKWISSSIFYPGTESPDIDQDELSYVLDNIWNISHITTRDIRKHMGLTQAAFAERFCISLRTVQGWESQHRNAPRYVILLLAESAGMLRVKRI